jgi:hypothetical protein
MRAMWGTVKEGMRKLWNRETGKAKERKNKSKKEGKRGGRIDKEIEKGYLIHEKRGNLWKQRENLANELSKKGERN